MTSQSAPYVIYRLTSRTSGKSYLGKTKDLNHRIRRHVCYARHGSTYALHRAIRKYGFDDFELTVMAGLQTEEEAFEAERELIRSEGTKAPNGYNMTDGGEGPSGCYPSEATRLKRSLSLKGRAPAESTKRAAIAHNTGRKRSFESRQKQSESMSGRRLSDEHRARIAAAATGRKMGPLSAEHRKKVSDGQRGKLISAETRKRMSEAQRGRVYSDADREKLRAGWVRWRERRAAERLAWLLVDEQ